MCDAGTQYAASPASSGARGWPALEACASWKPGLVAVWPPGRAWRPLLSLVQGRLQQPAELRCRLRKVQPCQAGQDPISRPAAPDGTTTAGVPAAVVLP